MRRRVHFKADGKDYSLRFGTNAMARYQELTGEKIGDALQRLEGGGDILLLRKLFWVALEQDCAEPDAGDLIDEVGLQEAGRLFGEAMQAAFPEAKAEPADPQKAPATS